MICKECRAAARLARAVLNAPPADVPMGALYSTLRRHGECKGGTWCDCKHQLPAERKSRG